LPGAPLTEPYLWASHTALRDAEVPTAFPTRVACAPLRFGRKVFRQRPFDPQLSQKQRGCPGAMTYKHCKHGHRRWEWSRRGPWLRHRATLRSGYTHPSVAAGPLRAVGCPTEQPELSHLFTGRGRLPSPPRTSGLGRLSTAFRYYATIRLLPSLRHLVASTATARGFPPRRPGDLSG
jgi:hypothetical protein